MTILFAPQVVANKQNGIRPLDLIRPGLLDRYGGPQTYFVDTEYMQYRPTKRLAKFEITGFTEIFCRALPTVNLALFMSCEP